MIIATIGRRFAAALLPRLFGKNPRSYHKGATGKVRTGDQRLPVLCHCQLGRPTASRMRPGINRGKRSLIIGKIHGLTFKLNCCPFRCPKYSKSFSFRNHAQLAQSQKSFPISTWGKEIYRIQLAKNCFQSTLIGASP